MPAYIRMRLSNLGELFRFVDFTIEQVLERRLVRCRVWFSERNVQKVGHSSGRVWKAEGIDCCGHSLSCFIVCSIDGVDLGIAGGIDIMVTSESWVDDG